MTIEAVAERLLPCPFCGGPAVVVGRGPFHVWCISCNTRGNQHYDLSPGPAIAAWNRRTPASGAGVVLPLDPKGLEAAEVAWRASIHPTCKGMLTEAITAYLKPKDQP